MRPRRPSSPRSDRSCVSTETSVAASGSIGMWTRRPSVVITTATGRRSWRSKRPTVASGCDWPRTDAPYGPRSLSGFPRRASRSSRCSVTHAGSPGPAPGRIAGPGRMPGRAPGRDPVPERLGRPVALDAASNGALPGCVCGRRTHRRFLLTDASAVAHLVPQTWHRGLRRVVKVVSVRAMRHSTPQIRHERAHAVGSDGQCVCLMHTGRGHAATRPNHAAKRRGRRGHTTRSRGRCGPKRPNGAARPRGHAGGVGTRGTRAHGDAGGTPGLDCRQPASASRSPSVSRDAAARRRVPASGRDGPESVRQPVAGRRGQAIEIDPVRRRPVRWSTEHVTLARADAE